MFANGSAARLLNATSATSLVGRSLLAFVHPDFVARGRRRLDRLRDGETIPTMASRWLTVDGLVRDVDVSSISFDFGGRRAVHTVFRDTTAHRHLEEQLRQAQKMEAVGQLAGGVAHDFNNLLTVIKVNAEFLLEDLPAASSLRAEVMEVNDAANRAATLTRQLLAFSRKQVLLPRVLDVNAVIVGLKPILMRLLRSNITMETRLAPEIETVLADAGQLEQVLLNLVVNARDAMPDGGTVLIATMQLTVADDSVFGDASPVAAGAYVMIAVSDTGSGIPADVRPRIFEPFFTTKALGDGTGLGLATVHGIVKQSGGFIDVESECGRGTTFRILLPVVRRPQAEEASA